MVCKKCGENIAEGRSFCANCGMAVDKMDDYVQPMPMKYYDFMVNVFLPITAAEGFIGAASVLYYMFGDIINTVVYDEDGMALVVGLVVMVLNIVTGAVALTARTHLSKFWADGPGWMMVLKLLVTVPVWLILVAMFVLTPELREPLLMILMGIFVLVPSVVWFICDTVYFKRRLHLFIK